MPRANIWLILIVLISMLGVWYFGSSHPSAEDPSLQASTLPSAEEEVTPAVPVKATPSRKQIRRTQLQSEIENLQAELARKSQELEIQKQTLIQLQHQQAGFSINAGYKSQMDTRDLAIQNLVEDLGNYRQAEDDINRSAALAMRNQDSEAALARTEVDANVQALEQDIRNTQNDLNYWKNYPVGQDVVYQPAQIERLETLLNEQKNRLNELRTNRVSISARVLSNTQVVQSLAEQAKAELRGDAAATQDQIYNLRSEIDSLQRSQAVNQNQLRGINQQISRTEQELETNAAEIRRLQDSIQSKQSEIQSQ
jgi:chromosome segregation ATPase